MILVADVETSGLWREDLDPLAPEQPNLVSIGARLYDRNWREAGRLSVLVKPEGWHIEAGAEAAHGISTARCARYGVPLGAALVPFMGMAEAAGRIVFHHANFDRAVIAAAIARAGGSGIGWKALGRKLFCTMEASTDDCKLPGKFAGYKFPSLAEACAILCPGVDLTGAHDVDVDIAATTALYRALVAGGHVAEFTGFDVEIA